MTKREIYYIIFNKHFADGRFKADSYVVGSPSEIDGKIPQSITIREGKVTVVFTDGCRHIFNYDDKVEYFDNIKDANKDTDNTK